MSLIRSDVSGQRAAVRHLVHRFARSGHLSEGMRAVDVVGAYATYAGVNIEVAERNFAPAVGVCGASYLERSADASGRLCIVVDSRSTPWHREHSVLHELGHVLCGHFGVASESTGAVVEAQAEYAATLLASWQQLAERAYPGELNQIQGGRYAPVREQIAWL
jgi:hypothetical protein